MPHRPNTDKYIHVTPTPCPKHHLIQVGNHSIPPICFPLAPQGALRSYSQASSSSASQKNYNIKKQPSFYSVVQFQFYSATTSSKVLIQLPKKKIKGSADLQSAGMAETTSHSQESSWCLKIFICDRIANLSQPNDLSQGCFSPSNTSAEQDNIFGKEQNLLGGHLKVHLHPI